jgi:hypothetical protein
VIFFTRNTPKIFAPPSAIGKNMTFWRKIMIFHTKYPKYFLKIIMNTCACFMDHENNLSPPLFTDTLKYSLKKLHFTSVFYVICLAPIHCKPKILHIHLLV